MWRLQKLWEEEEVGEHHVRCLVVYAWSSGLRSVPFSALPFTKTRPSRHLDYRIGLVREFLVPGTNEADIIDEERAPR